MIFVFSTGGMKIYPWDHQMLSLTNLSLFLDRDEFYVTGWLLQLLHRYGRKVLY